MATGGFALPNYNEASAQQRKMLLKATQTFIEILNFSPTLTNGTITIADYGSSEVYNSMVFLSRTLQKFREISSQPILVFHNDLPENNWVTSYKTLLESQESYTKIPDIYFSAIGRSFYDQILPNNSVHIGFSSAAIHWLSQPLSAPDHILPSSSNDVEFKAKASELAHRDLVTFLSHRHKELVNNGRLLLQFADSNNNSSLASTVMQQVSINLVERGVITEEEKRDLTMPIYRRSNEEIQLVLEEVANLFRVISIEKIEAKRYEGVSDEHLREVVQQIKKYGPGMMRTPLERAIKRGGEEFERIFEIFAKEACEVFDTIDTRNSLSSYHSIVLEKIPE